MALLKSLFVGHGKEIRNVFARLKLTSSQSHSLRPHFLLCFGWVLSQSFQRPNLKVRGAAEEVFAHLTGNASRPGLVLVPGSTGNTPSLLQCRALPPGAGGACPPRGTLHTRKVHGHIMYVHTPNMWMHAQVGAHVCGTCAPRHIDVCACTHMCNCAHEYTQQGGAQEWDGKKWVRRLRGGGRGWDWRWRRVRRQPASVGLVSCHANLVALTAPPL